MWESKILCFTRARMPSDGSSWRDDAAAAEAELQRRRERRTGRRRSACTERVAGWCLATYCYILDL